MRRSENDRESAKHQGCEQRACMNESKKCELFKCDKNTNKQTNTHTCDNNEANRIESCAMSLSFAWEAGRRRSTFLMQKSSQKFWFFAAAARFCFLHFHFFVSGLTFYFRWVHFLHSLILLSISSFFSFFVSHFVRFFFRFFFNAFSVVFISFDLSKARWRSRFSNEIEIEFQHHDGQTRKRKWEWKCKWSSW